MLKNDFFTFAEPTTEENIIKAHIQLNGTHPIFKGHFPGQPVLPGVCMMQMVKEVAEHCLNMRTKLIKADDLKFLSFIYPGQNQQIQMELKINAADERIKAEARLLDATQVFFKFKGIFVRR